MNEDLKQHNDSADALIQKLERIKDLWDQLPTQDDMEDLARSAAQVAGLLEQARETWMDDDVPTLDALQNLAKEAAATAESLDAVSAASEGGAV